MRVLLTGHNGAMGRFLIEMIEAKDQWEVVGGIDRTYVQGLNFPQFQTFSDVNIEADVLIDFSHHSLIPDLLDFIEIKKIPSVICTTGLSEDSTQRIELLAKTIPVFQSGNMSLGINLLIDLVKKAAEVLGQAYDIELIEKHHHRKVDAPSGTALMIAKALNEVKDNQMVFKNGRSGTDAKRQPNEIGIHAVRGGSIVGEHEVIFAGDDEIIEIRHIASSRRVFAQGALRAAEFIVTQSPGLYDMNLLLKE